MSQPASIKEDGLGQLSRSAENAKRIKSVQDKFVNSQSLMKEGRALVGEGILMKVCRKKPKQRAFFLFNDILVYGRVVINGHKYSQQKIIPLNEVQISNPIDSEENPYSWLICSPKKSFIVHANSDRERQEWISHLERCIQHASGGNNAQNNTVAAHWVPDDKADTCMHCRTTKFSTYNRKHHCRNCGFIVCEGCSKKRFLLPHLDSKRVRVCDTCFIKLNMNNMNEPRQNTRDSSDSDGEENHAHYSPVPATFYQNIENF
ncbi:unnamed protein product [Rotaria magnacalcarata]|nr:unnamed protein product [Rotaria magnacalcarata]CAF1569194.1 unnamed protein product [Rotaria magnacalcarata]CAF4017917.1 unnamed protein product [Rotaria magnacalcarata]CAF4110227.1 unnamed protein product [Rotaria magnacalcarata]CAF4313293.1 unnamed protein product [Rotaria magnacalcarata]